MITKGLIKSVDGNSNRCIVRLPLFETASSSVPVEIEALISITPGLYNNLYKNDVVFVAFEENALEKPIVIGKLYTGVSNENKTPGGAGVLKTLVVRDSGQLPAANTKFIYEYDEGEPRSPKTLAKDNVYYSLQTPKNIADYIKWLEQYLRNLVNTFEANFKCFKNWTQWQLKSENVEVDDGDIDKADYYDNYESICAQYQKDNGKCASCDGKCAPYQKENSTCKICGVNCTKNNVRKYAKLTTDKEFPNL